MTAMLLDRPATALIQLDPRNEHAPGANRGRLSDHPAEAVRGFRPAIDHPCTREPTVSPNSSRSLAPVNGAASPRTYALTVAAKGHGGAAEQPVDLVIRRLEAGGFGPTQSGGGWKSRCPAHDGGTQNLKVDVGADGRVLLKCHRSDCPPEAVLEKLGLSMKDLFPAGLENPAGRKSVRTAKTSLRSAEPVPRQSKPVKLYDTAAGAVGALRCGTLTARYDYRAASGNHVMSVCRFQGEDGSKTFRPVSLDPYSGHWAARQMSGPLPIYRLNELADAATVFVLEGERCADLAAGLGLASTTTAHGAKSPAKSDLSPLAGRNVVIIPDNDEAGAAYAAALVGLLSALDPKPAVKVVDLPGLAEAGDDLAEWLQARPDLDAAGKRAELIALAEAVPVIGFAPPEPLPDIIPIRPAGPASPDDGAELQPNEAPDDPSRLARLFRDTECMHPDGQTIRYWQGGFWEWSEAAYRLTADEELRARLAASAKQEFDRVNLEELKAWYLEKAAAKGTVDEIAAAKGKPKVRKVTGPLINNVTLNLSAVTTEPNLTRQPSWLDGLAEGPPFPADEVLAARNGLVHLAGLESPGGKAFMAPTPLFFNPNALNYDFDPSLGPPVAFLKFLEEVWPSDLDARRTLQEWAGYLLTGDTSHQKILMIIGDKRSGKGTVAKVLEALIGPENMVNPKLASFSTTFGAASLIGKPAAIVTDARLSGKSDVSQIVEQLLTISGADPQTIARKFQSDWHGYLTTRFMIISNELPRLTDTSGAMASRMIVLPMTESFLGREDPRLFKDRLLPEMPAILNWAIEGWIRLRKNGRFTQPASGRELVEQLEELTSPVGAFLKECCRVEPTAEVARATLYTAWVGWCKENGKDHPGDTHVFGRNLRAACPGLVDSQPYDRETGKKVRVYVGLGLSRSFSY